MAQRLKTCTAGSPSVQGHSQLLGQLEVTLGYQRPCLKKQTCMSQC